VAGRGEHPHGAARDRRRVAGGELFAVAADQLARERAAALGPERDVWRVGHEPVPRARRAGLGAIDLKLGGIEIDRHLSARVAAQRPVQPAADPGQGALNRLDVTAAKTPGELTGGRRRRHPQRRAQPAPSAVGARILKVIEALAAGQLGFGHRHHQLAARHAAPAGLDRRRPPLTGQLCVDQSDQPQPPRQRAHDRQPGVRRQALIVGAKLDPSDRLVTVTTAHLQGDLHPRSRLGFITRHDPGPTGQKAPHQRGFQAFWLSRFNDPSGRPAPHKPQRDYSRM